VRAKQDDGTEVLLAQIGPGETLGEISLFNPGPAAATVTAVEFSQLWRIADADLMHFMEENPGAGNVLLRTLASILAQRLRQMNPKAFGLSTYAVVDSPELHQQSASGESEKSAGLATAAAAIAAVTAIPAALAEPPKTIPAVPPREASPSYQDKRVSTETQIVPDLDELESL
jgi:CRP-like cAMP-binding protein